MIELTKEKRLISFIKNNPTHSVAQQFVVRKKTKEEEEKETDNRLRQREKLVLSKVVSREKRERREEFVSFLRSERVQKKKDKIRRIRMRRVARIVDWYLKGLTYEKVGKRFGITRERVRQILNRAKTDGLNFEIRGHRRREDAYQTRICPCGKEFQAYIPVGGTSKRQTCSRECKQKYHIGYKYQSKAEQHQAIREKHRWRYRNDLGFRRRGDLARKNYYLKIRHEPRYIEQQKRNSKRWLEKVLSDPIRKEKYLLQQKETARRMTKRYRLLKVNNPKKYRKLREADNVRHRRYLQKLLKDPIRAEQYRTRINIYSRKKYQALKADPKRYKKLLMSMKLSYAKRKRLINKKKRVK